MTVQEQPTKTAAKGSGRLGWSVALALVPAAIVLVAQLIITTVGGHPQVWGSVEVYRLVMNAAVLLRLFGMFIAVVLVWWELRHRRCSMAVLALAVGSGPVAYSFVAFVGALSAFPPAQALYYAVNPLFIAALGAQVGFAGAVELLWRAVGRRRGRWSSTVLTSGPALAVLGGFAVLFVAVLANGGTTGFYLYQLGYRALFG